MRFNQGLFDGHVHTHGGIGVDKYLEFAKMHLLASGLDGENLITVRHGRAGCQSDCVALLAKAVFPGKFTVMGNVANHTEGFDCSAEGLRAQLQELIDAGLDGLKMADGETQGGPLNDTVFDPMFELLAAEKFPVLYHAPNPEYYPPRRFFDESRNSDGRNGIDPAKKQQEYDELDDLLTRHPGVTITFPHFYFHSRTPDKLAQFLDKHPGAHIDITPCAEQYYFISQDLGTWRELLVAYQDRFILGTDNVTSLDPAPVLAAIRHFLETDEEFYVPFWGYTLHGIAPLPEEVLQKIYKDNFRRICPSRPLDYKKAEQYCLNLYERVKDFAEMPDASKQEILDVAERFRDMM